MFKIIFLFAFTLLVFVECHPTMYKLKDNKLEPDLVAVSSTVIPLPVYKVSYSLNASPNYKDEKIIKPDGPISLITVHSKKKLPPTTKPTKVDEKSIVKEVV